MIGNIRQLTRTEHGHILTNANVWSADGMWIVYDIRSDPAGACFDGSRIERVHAESGRIEVLYESRNAAMVGVATCHPHDDRVIFIHGPEFPTPDWTYSACHREGVIIRPSQPGSIEPLDARCLTDPYTPGALRGGTHVHTFSPDGEWVAFTYEDHVLEQRGRNPPDGEINQRNIGISIPGKPVRVRRDHPRNRDGEWFSVLVTRTSRCARPGTNDILRGFEDAWLAGSHPGEPRRLAFLGEVLDSNGNALVEVFTIELPLDPTLRGEFPIEGTSRTAPAPPEGVTQRRLTFTAERKHPGIQGTRHWPRSSPRGERIAFLMRDDSGITQLWTIPCRGGEPGQLTQNAMDISSAFTWSRDATRIAHVMDGSICITDTANGETRRITCRFDPPPRPEACVFSPDGRRIAFVLPVNTGGGWYNQIFVVE